MQLEIWIYSLISVFIVSLISLVGVITLALSLNKLKTIIFFFVSFSVGALFGDAFIHLIPEAIKEHGLNLTFSLSLIIGILFFFVIEKFVHWRHCHEPTTKQHPHPYATMNMVGDSVHNFIDGLVIGASYLASIPLGIATTTAIIMHEIPQEIGDFSVLIHGGYTKLKALFFNFITALTAVLGTIIALVLGSNNETFLAFLLPFTAGGFIYIAGSDLIPELHKEMEIKKSILQLIGICAGIGIMILLLE